jgi:hypothetical protein
MIVSGVSAVFLWASLPDGLAMFLASSAAQVFPTPHVVVVSEGSHPDLFNLARAGARAHLRWPATSEDVGKCLENTSESPTDLEIAVRLLVGQVVLKDAQTLLRRAMLRRALAISNGSRRAAARILGVTRPAVQRMIREDLDGEVLQHGAGQTMDSRPSPSGFFLNGAQVNENVHEDELRIRSK